MGSEFFHTITAVALAIVGLGIVATIVSRNANTAGVISASSSGFASALTAAEAPVTNSSGLGLTGGMTLMGSPLD